MKADFSEFSYGYAVTEEIVAKNKATLIAAPLFPSLYEEGKAGGGYDVKIPLTGTPVFLQFKLSDYLGRANAKEYPSPMSKLPYYRMHLRPRNHSDQHQLLIDLEVSGESVFYIAPEFHRATEFNKFYLTKNVVSKSAIISPTDIGSLKDDEEHYVVFERGSSIGYFCSDNPIAIKKNSLAEGLNHFLQSRDIHSRSFGEEGLYQIRNHMVSVLRHTRRFRNFDLEVLDLIVSNRPTIAAVGYISRTFFNAELLILTE